MRDTFIIAAREIRQRVSLFYLAAASAVLPLLSFLVPAGSGVRGDTIVAAAGIVSVTLLTGLALVLGGTMITSEVVGRRMSFYLARPVSAAAIWFGKLFAAVLLTFGAFLVAALPAYLVAPKAFHATLDSPARVALWVLAASVFLILAAHAGATAVRSRSAIIGLDVLMLAVCVAVVWLVASTLLQATAILAAAVFVLAFLIALTAALLAGGAWQVARGRVDARRNHVELSKFVWTAMGIFTALFGAVAIWFVSVQPSDLKAAFYIKQAPQGPWVMMTGKYRGRLDYVTSIVYNAGSGDYVRLAAVPYEASFSRDGRWLLSVRPAELMRGSFELAVTDLQGEPRTVATGIRMPRYGAAPIISDDGSRVAVQAGNLAVHDLATGRLLGSIRLPFRPGWMFFDGPDRIRLISDPHTQPMSLAEFDLTRRALTVTGRITVDDQHVRLSATADGSRLLLERWSGSIAGRSVQLLDGRSGVLLADLGRVGAGLGALFVSDGRLAVCGTQQDRGVVRLYASNGAHLRDADLGPSVWPMYPVEVGGRLAVLRRPAPGQRKGHDVVTVDLASGAVKDGGPFGLVWGDWATDPRSAPSAPNRPLLIGDRRGTMMAWDPATGATHRITK